MGIKIGPLEIDTDYSSSETSYASSSSDEEKKMKKKAAKGKDHKYKPDAVGNYEKVIGAPTYRKKGEERKKTKFLPPPDNYEASDASVPVNLPKDVGKMDETEARAALVKYVDNRSCWRTGAAESMEIKNLKLSCAYVYKVDVFTEVRKVKWKTTPYKKGSKFEPPAAGAAPMPWDMDAKAPAYFKEEKKKVEVPFTASVRKCWYCKGKGKTKCRSCKGEGHFQCKLCSGEGTTMGSVLNAVGEFEEMAVPCVGCAGTGHAPCARCKAQGHYNCKNCGGQKKIKWFIEANCKWEKHKDERVFEDTALPDELVSEVKGQIMFKDEQQILKPLAEFPESHVLQFSKELIPKMLDKYKKDGKILRMRHTVEAIPVTECDWSFDGASGRFFIYGLDKMVYFPDYPQQCCCSLL